MKWYLITSRLDGDDEDTLLVTQAVTPKAAVAKAEHEHRLRFDHSSEFYLNAVIECDTEPRVIKHPEAS